MPTVPLPQDPDLGQLRTRARELQRAVRAGEPDARSLVAELHPVSSDLATFPLSAAQLVLARQHGFASWPQLRRHVEIVHARSWTPGAAAPEDEPVADRFLRLACLTYSDDGPADRVAAAALLDEHPELPDVSLPVAAACADVASVRRFLTADPSLARAVGPPHGWSPLLYQAYARHDPEIGWEATAATARLLLEGGADPNDGRFWHGLPTPFTVLTGVFGAGEQDQPPHPHAIGFARLLLEAGADPNDGQTLYNRMFRSDDDHLVVLFEFGLGGETGGPWHRLLGDALESPPVMLRNLLWWAITHDQEERVELLATNGVDVVAPFTELRMHRTNGSTPLEVALTSGHRALADTLIALGAPRQELDPIDAFVAAVMAGDEVAARSADSATVDAVRRRRPGLPVWAAAQGSPRSVPLLVEAGFDVNAYGRSDIPSDQPWQTALHIAAENGDVALARALLDLGADPERRDQRYDATPLGWAEHFGHQAVVDLLAPLTRGPEASP
jgi:ankyrin repeat protein